MEVLYILNTLILGIMLWDIHRGVGRIEESAERIAKMATEISTKTDEVLNRLPRSN